MAFRQRTARFECTRCGIRFTVNLAQVAKAVSGVGIDGSMIVASGASALYRTSGLAPEQVKERVMYELAVYRDRISADGEISGSAAHRGRRQSP